jgi:hypothetical protein
MKTIYVVLPFTTNYGRPVTEKLKSFGTREKAIAYADGFKYVELITTKLNG